MQRCALHQHRQQLYPQRSNRVMAAKAATHDRQRARGLPWVPAFAGMTA
jgi:hypothetical protein